MQKISVKDARQNIGHILDQINTGEEFIILRRGKPAARMSKVNGEKISLKFPNRSSFRKKLPPMLQKSSALIRDIRDERG